MPPRRGVNIDIHADRFPHERASRALVVVYNVPRCTMGKQGVRKEGYLQDRRQRNHGGEREQGQKESIVYAATNSLRFAGVTYCPGAGAHAATIYTRAVYVCTHTRHGLPFCICCIYYVNSPIHCSGNRRRDAFAESANYFARSPITMSSAYPGNGDIRFRFAWQTL